MSLEWENDAGPNGKVLSISSYMDVFALSAHRKKITNENANDSLTFFAPFWGSFSFRTISRVKEGWEGGGGGACVCMCVRVSAWVWEGGREGEKERERGMLEL